MIFGGFKQFFTVYFLGLNNKLLYHTPVNKCGGITKYEPDKATNTLGYRYTVAHVRHI